MKISKYYIDKAKYRAEDENGNIIWLEVDYWNNKYKVSSDNKIINDFAKTLLNRKHRVNLVDKVIQ